MNLIEAYTLGRRIAKEWKTLRKLAVGVVGSLPAIRLDIGGGYWEFGPFPVRRLR